MAPLIAPVVRRSPDDPLVYVFARQADGWTKHGVAFETLEQVEQSGWVIGVWQSDRYGDFAPLTRPH